MKNDFMFSLSVQNSFDSFYIEAYEKGLVLTMKEVSEVLDVSASVVKNYLIYCSSEFEKATIFKCMMNTLKFSNTSELGVVQKRYLERQAEMEKLKQRRDAIKAAKRLYEMQQKKKGKTK